eukprot:scaffold3153_cov92-Cylindrotheca_fusiformis.AAC.3
MTLKSEFTDLKKSILQDSQPKVVLTRTPPEQMSPSVMDQENSSPTTDMETMSTNGLLRQLMMETRASNQKLQEGQNGLYHNLAALDNKHKATRHRKPPGLTNNWFYCRKKCSGWIVNTENWFSMSPGLTPPRFSTNGKRWITLTAKPVLRIAAAATHPPWHRRATWIIQTMTHPAHQLHPTTPCAESNNTKSRPARTPSCRICAPATSRIPTATTMSP